MFNYLNFTTMFIVDDENQKQNGTQNGSQNGQQAGGSYESKDDRTTNVYETHNVGNYSHTNTGYFVAFVFIAIGVVYLLNAFGIISWSLMRILISWQMLLIVLGVGCLIKRQYIGGLILFFLGIFFMMPKFDWYDFGHSIGALWPVIFIIIGIAILLRRKEKPQQHYHNQYRSHDGKNYSDQAKNNYSSADGFVFSEVVFGSTNQIVLEPYFKGAELKTSFGSTILDLTRTNLIEKETYINLECAFGSVEVIVPRTWMVILQVQPVLSGCNDKRYFDPEKIDHEHVLFIRGNVTFGGVEVKN